MIVGNGAERAADPRLLEEDAASAVTRRPAIAAVGDVQQAAGVDQEDRTLVGRPSSVILIFGVAAEHELAEAVQEIGEPIVAMRRMMPGWLTRWRMTSRSMAGAARP